MPYEIKFELCASLFLILLMIMSATRKRLEGYLNRIFRFYTVICLVNSIVDIVSTILLHYNDSVPRSVHWLVNGFYLVVRFIIPTIFLIYLYCKITNRSESTRKWFRIFLIPAAIGVILTLSSYATHLVYYIDGAGYKTGPAHILLYINSIIYIVISVVWAIRWKGLFSKECIYVIAMILVNYIPEIIQFFVPYYLLTGLGNAFCIYVMYFGSESQVDFVDQVSGAFNREALLYEMDEYAKIDKSINIYAIALDNFKMVNEIYGMEGGNRMMRKLVKKLQSEFGVRNVFRYSGDIFTVIVDEEIGLSKGIDVISNIFRVPFELNGLDVPLSACICLVNTNKQKTRRVFSAIEYGISQAKQRGKAQFFEVEGKTVDTIERRQVIEQTIMAEIRLKRFEVHYQPIYDIKNKCVSSLEALARLQVPGYGYVSPEEFIKIAEKNGTIVQIGRLVIEEVCKFIRENNLLEKGIKFVEINLSVVQCMRERLYKDIGGILEKYEIPPEVINLEITESAAAYSEDRLLRNMARLSMNGITFSLDDYGSGYSNIGYIVEMPFSIVKIDKFFVWGAMKKASTREILKNTIKMFKNINKMVVTEGIENEEMVNMVTRMGADYIQGYYYSKPVPRDKVIETIDRINKIYKEDRNEAEK